MITTYLDTDRLHHLTSHSISHQTVPSPAQDQTGRNKNLDACLLLKRGLNDYTKENDGLACREKNSGYFLAEDNKFMLTKRRPVGPQVKWPWPKWRSKFTFIAAKRYEAIIVRLFIDGLAACFPAAQHMHAVRSGNSGRLYFKVVKTVPLPPTLQPCSLQIPNVWFPH